MYLVMFGPPGSGKGTQAGRLSRDWNIPQISTGDMLRDAVRRESPTGLEAKGYMDRGELVPDDLMTRVVEERLARADCEDGFLLDGFPRTIAQAESLEAMLRARGKTIEGVISLRVDEREVVQRMVGRGRADDSEEVIRNRLMVYRQETEPLVQYFRERGKLIEVDGAGPVEVVTDRIRAAVSDIVPG